MRPGAALAAGESKGQPVSGKFEVDEGHFQLSVYTAQGAALPDVSGRLDHMAVDLEKRRLFVAAVANGTLEVLDLGAGKLINSIPGIKDAQDALFLGGQFNKLYVSSLDGTLRIFQGGPFD